MAKKRKALSAKDVGKDPSLLDSTPGRFALLRDTEPFDTMVNTLDLIVSRGWHVAGMSTNPNTMGTGIEMYVLVQHEQTTSGEEKPWPFDA